jgi:hypothetical protein
MNARERLADLQKQGFMKPLRTRRKPSRPKHDERAKLAIAAWTARFLRRSGGKLTKKEARELGTRYGTDLHWKYMRTMGDKIALRDASTVTPDGRIEGEGSFLRLWRRDSFGFVFSAERRAPRRWASSDYAGNEIARHMGYYFGWLGPQSGIWPGDFLAFDTTIDDVIGRERGWRVACAPDCPCGRCWRPRG